MCFLQFYIGEPLLTMRTSSRCESASLATEALATDLITDSYVCTKSQEFPKLIEGRRTPLYIVTSQELLTNALVVKPQRRSPEHVQADAAGLGVSRVRRRCLPFCSSQCLVDSIAALGVTKEASVPKA